jgi:hypothetical protein
MTSGGNLFEKCPEDVQKTIQQMVQRQGNIMSVIKTYDLTTFQVRIEGNNVLINV